jgi:hypothetical protein
MTQHASFRAWAAKQDSARDTVTCPRCHDLNYYDNERCTSCNAILGASKCLLCGAPIPRYGHCRAHRDISDLEVT